MPDRLTEQTRTAVAPLLLQALRNAEVGVAVKSEDGSYLYASGLPHYFPEIVTPGGRDEDLFEDDWLEEFRQGEAEVLRSGQKVVLELVRTTNTQYSICECTIQRYEAPGVMPAVLLTFFDLTPERKREDTLKALLREVSHRSKNLLAIVQSIATQTARTSDRLDVFLVKFRGRVAALSSAQDLVTESNWRGAHFKELAKQQLSRYVEPGDARVVIEGEDILLSPNGATHIGLALHELITNSVAFGALSRRDGQLRLECHRTSDGDFAINWNETSGRPPSEPDPSHIAENGKQFGSAVLERVVPSALEGQAEYAIEPTGVSYRLQFKAR